MSEMKITVNMYNRRSISVAIKALTAILAALPEEEGDSPPESTHEGWPSMFDEVGNVPAGAPAAVPQPPAPLTQAPANTATVSTPATPTPAPIATVSAATLAAPVPPAAPPVVSTLEEGDVPSVHLDSEGLPWDERIHQAAKGRMQKGAGAWKIKRGCDEALVEQVKNELRISMQAQPAAPAPTAASAPATQGMQVISQSGVTELTVPFVENAPTAQNMAGAATVPPAPAVANGGNVAPPVTVPAPAQSVAPAPAATAGAIPPPPSATTTPSVPAAPANGHTFATLLAACTAAGIGQDQIANAASQASGGTVNSVPLLGPRADLVPAVAAMLGV